jgi:hypothetical protein
MAFFISLPGNTFDSPLPSSRAIASFSQSVLARSRLFYAIHVLQTNFDEASQFEQFFCETSMAQKEREPVSDAIEMVRVRVLPDGRMDRQSAARYLRSAAQDTRNVGSARKGAALRQS